MKLLVILAFVLCISVGKHSSNSTLFCFKVYRMDKKSAATGSNMYRQRYIAMILYILGLVRGTQTLFSVKYLFGEAKIA